MPPNIGFATTPATLDAELLTLTGPSDPVFVSPGVGVEGEEGELIARSVAVQQGTTVCGGPASLGDAKSWTAKFEAPGITTGPATATGVEVIAFPGPQSPLAFSFTWSQDITIERA